MRLDEFDNLLKEYKKGSDMITELNGIGINLIDGKYKILESLYSILISSLRVEYSDDGIEWVTWFIFETEWGEKKPSKPKYRLNKSGLLELKENDKKHYWALSENGVPICYDIPSLWRYLENGYKKINCNKPPDSIH